MSDAATARVGLVGVGNMGGALASRLAPGFDLRVHDVDPARLDRVAAEVGATAVKRLDGLADCETVVLCLPHPEHSRTVVAGLAPRLAPGAVIVEASTLGPDQLRANAETAAAHDVDLIDAAIAAGVAGMAAGRATLLVGGPAPVVERVRPVLEAMASSIELVGGLGAGATAKVINNAVAHAVMVVLVEAAALAEAGGLDRRHLVGLLTGEDAGLTRPLEHRLLQRIAHGDFEGGMPTDAALKDSQLAQRLGHDLGVPLFAIAGSHPVYEMAAARGWGRLDYAAVVKLWEEWLGTSLGAPTGGPAGPGPQT